MKYSHFVIIGLSVVAAFSQTVAGSIPPPWGAVVGAVGSLCIALSAAFGLTSPAMTLPKAP